ncbi:polymorphic toxin-type HINT domain-containing protein [Chryseosolibacter indicus]|uniref:DNA/RNA non-specific endonuclease n=1 Tax=Chryseosolibacter indicus TaxID=2782351 RepID=A0ABS5VXI3_9BACT|nr:polymorphic toxin-type HINT domain-containing protein [Chryseosolibacter indicus]MBT1706119.1 DNA/RNA non-specific endonuclease [Chryseosolibacter indicus]
MLDNLKQVNSPTSAEGKDSYVNSNMGGLINDFGDLYGKRPSILNEQEFKKVTRDVNKMLLKHVPVGEAILLTQFIYFKDSGGLLNPGTTESQAPKVLLTSLTSVNVKSSGAKSEEYRQAFNQIGSSIQYREVLQSAYGKDVQDAQQMDWPLYKAVLKVLTQSITAAYSISRGLNASSPVPATLANENGAFTFLTPSGTQITLPGTIDRPYFYQRIFESSDGKNTIIPQNSSIVAGTLAGFYQGSKHFRASFEGDEFVGYKAGSVLFEPIDYMNTSMIMGLVCIDGFNYVKFKVTSGPITRHPNMPIPVVSEAGFPFRPFSSTARVEQSVKADHAALTHKAPSEKERLVITGMCNAAPEVIPLIKLGQLATVFPSAFDSFIGNNITALTMSKHWSAFVAAMQYDGYGSGTLPENKWIQQVNASPELQQLFNKDKYMFFAATVEQFQKQLDELAMPPSLVENGFLTFLTPAGTKIPLPQSVRDLSFLETVSADGEDDVVPGALMGFKIDGVSYQAQLLNGTFLGYSSGTRFYTNTQSTPSHNVILGLPAKLPSGLVFRLVKFNIPDVKQHGAGSAPVKPAEQYTFKNTSIAEVVFSEAQLKEQSLVKPLLTYSPIETRIIEKYGKRSEFLPAFKAAQLGAKYPGLLEVYTQLFDAWERATIPSIPYWDELVYRSKENSSGSLNYVELWKTDPHTFYKEFIKSFKREIVRWTNFKKPEFLAKVAEPDYLKKLVHWEVKLALDKFTPEDRKALSAEQRARILHLLTRDILVGGTYEAPEALQLLPIPIEFSIKGNETTALDIIESTPSQQWKDMLDKLVAVEETGKKADHRLLLHALAEDFDGQEFERFIMNVASWVEQTVPKPDANYHLKAIEEGKGFPLHPGLWDGSAVSKSFSDDGKKVLLNTSETIVTGFHWVRGADGLEYRPIEVTKHYNVVASPYEYILVQFKETFYLSETKRFEKGERKLMPAIFGYMIFNRMNAKRLQRAAKLGVDIALVSVGGVGMVAEWGTLNLPRRAKAVFDLGIGVGSIIVYQNELDIRLKDTEDGRRFLELWNMIQLYSNTMDAIEIISNLNKVANSLIDRNKNPSLLDADRLTIQKIVDEINVECSHLPIPGVHLPPSKYVKLEAQLQKLTSKERAAFDAMFAGKTGHLERFEAKPELLNGWLIVKDDPFFTDFILSGVADRNFASLDQITTYLQKNPHLRASLLAEYDALTKDGKVAWTLRLNQFADLRAIEEKLATLDAKLRPAFRQQYSGEYFASVVSAVNERPAFIDAWQILRSKDAHSSNLLINGTAEDVKRNFEAVADYLQSTGRSVDDVISEFKTINTYEQQKAWIANLATMARSTFARFEGNTFRWLQVMEQQNLLATKSTKDGLEVIFKTSGYAAPIGEVRTNGAAKFHIYPATSEFRNYTGKELKYAQMDIDVTLNGTELQKADVGIVCKNNKCSVVPGACFVKGTSVHTSTGLKPIESIKAGDSVYAYNEKSKTRTLQPVARTFTRAFNKLVKVFTRKDTLLTTSNHPFFANNNWVPAKALRKGSQILLLSGLLTSVDSVAMVDSLATVYNFEVAGDHNYYVGVNGLLVHNASGGLCSILRETKYETLTLKDEVVKKLVLLEESHQRKILDFLVKHTDDTNLVLDYPSHIVAIENLWPEFSDKKALRTLLEQIPLSKIDEFVADTKLLKGQAARLAADPSQIKRYLRGTHWKRFRFLEMDDGLTFEKFIVEIDQKFVYHEFGEYMLKYDPDTKRALLVKVANDPSMDEVIDFMLDENGFVAGKGIDVVVQNLKTIYGLPGGKTEIMLDGRTIKLDPNKTTLLLGRYTPKVAGQMGTKELFEELTMFKTRNFSPRKGGVQMLNIPGNISKKGDWWTTFNGPYLNEMLKHDVNIFMVTDPTQAQFLVYNSSFTTFGNEMITLAEWGKLDFYFDPNDNYYKFVKKGTSPFHTIDLEILTRKIPPDDIAALLNNFHAVFGDTRTSFSFLKGITPGAHKKIIAVVEAGANRTHLQDIHKVGLKLQAADDKISITASSGTIGQLSATKVEVKKWVPGGVEQSKTIGDFILLKTPDNEFGFVLVEFNKQFKKLSDTDRTTFINDFKNRSQEDIKALVGDPDKDYLFGCWKWLIPSPLRIDMKHLEFSNNFSSTWTCKYEGGVTKVLNKKGELLAEMTETHLKGRGGTKPPSDWNPILSYHPPMANHIYVVSKAGDSKYDITYETDMMGRVHRAKGNMFEIERGRNETQQGNSVRLKDGISGTDHGGHIFANTTNGPGEQINYVPWNGLSNSGGEWRDMEKAIMELIRKHGNLKTVITFEYGSNRRPLKARVEAWAPNGKLVYSSPNPIPNP